MGVKERKQRERENLRRLILATAHELLLQEGLAGLNMRTLATHIEYSQSKIYEFFASKDQLCEVLCSELCEKLLEILRALPKPDTAEAQLTGLILTTMAFHNAHPHSDALFTHVCFGPQRFKIPTAFLEIEGLFKQALQQLKSPYLKTEREIIAALDIIRCLFIGVTTLMYAETSLPGRTRALAMTKNALSVLLRGWKQ